MKDPSVALVLVIAMSACSSAQESTADSSLPSGWMQTSAPVEGTTALQCANYSEKEWRVDVQSNEVRVSATSQPKTPPVQLPPRFIRTKEMLGKETVQKIGNGWLVGFNAGEFGGGLWWSNGDGSETKALSGENVQAFVQRGDEVLVFTGLAHLSMDIGKVYAYWPDDGAGRLVFIADVGSQPSAATLTANDTVLVATQKAIVALLPNNGIDKLYGRNEMAYLYPHSIVADENGTIYVGMRFYVLRLQRHQDAPVDATWLIPKICRKTKLKDFDCICTAKPF